MSRLVFAAHDAHHLGVAGLLIGDILDALAGRHGLGNAHDGGIDAVGGGLSDPAVGAMVDIVGVLLLSDSAVDGQVAHLLAAVEDVDFPQSVFHSRGGQGGERGGGQDAQECYKGEKEG